MDRSTAEKIITSTGWLSRQPLAIRNKLLAVANLSRYGQSEVVYGLGDDTGGLFGIVSGEFDLFIAPVSLPPLLAFIARPGWWTGDAALITKTSRRGTLMARTSGFLFHIEKSAIERICASDPGLWRSLAEITVSHLDHALKMVAALSQKDPGTRVVAVLSILATTPRKDESITLSLTHDELGEVTRLTRGALRKILLHLQDEGLVQLRYGRLIFPRPVLLQGKLTELSNVETAKSANTR